MKDSKIRAVEEFYLKASTVALAHVEQEARKILVEHPELDEFIMAMGVWHFSAKDQAFFCDDLDYIRDSKFFDFMSDWDDLLKLTGEPMRFTAKGPIVKDW